MKTFRVDVRQSCSRVFWVQAESADDARAKVLRGEVSADDDSPPEIDHITIDEQ